MEEVKLKPILFNTEMVRAILGNTKTVTRRVLKTEKYIPDDAEFGFTTFTPKGCISCRGTLFDESGGNRFGESFIKLPYCVGDILYVRETWNYLSLPEPLRGTSRTYLYKADGFEAGDKWRPSIHMPKEATRIFLRVTDVRVERLQDIITGDYRTPLNINREGIVQPCCFCTHHNGECKDFIARHTPQTLTCKLLEDFTLVWNSTIKKSDLDKYGWEANPWVEVVEFERISKEEVEK